jgi:hypothetical protein
LADIDTWIKIASFGLTISVGLYTYFATRSTKVDQRFKIGSDRMNEMEKRIASTEQTISSLPHATDFHRLELSLSEIGGDIKAMRVERTASNESLARMERVLTRHEEHLLSGDK